MAFLYSTGLCAKEFLSTVPTASVVRNNPTKVMFYAAVSLKMLRRHIYPHNDRLPFKTRLEKKYKY
jgi:hypothetical protein